MFESARIKLTLWYLLVIMSVSVFFSSFIYLNSNKEFNRVIRAQQFRTLHPEIRNFREPFFMERIPNSIQPDPDVLNDAKMRVISSLLGINIIILIWSALLGYILAGRTLKPIKNMVDEQNRFITDASHELNTPLTSLKTAIEVNLRDKKLTLADAKSLLNSNLEDINSLQFLSDGLIKLSKYQEINNDEILEKISLKDVVLEALDKLKALSKSKEIKFNLKLKQSYVNGDRKSLVELFTIILDNAIKYSYEKGKLDVVILEKDKDVVVEIKDYGLGIIKEDLAKIFTRFYRSDKSRSKNNYSGYGLGLSIAQRIINFHKGEITVDSELDKGTTFKIILRKF